MKGNFKSKKKQRLNKHITSLTVRLIDESGKILGVVSRDEALKKAESVKLDLVEVDPNSDPPTCKIFDYGKIKYDKQKKLNRTRRKQNVNVVKEIKLRPNIEQHDYSVKLRNVCSFLEDKYKVKVSMRFRGREMMYQENGMKIFNEIVNATEEIATLDNPVTKNNNQILMILVPK